MKKITKGFYIGIDSGGTKCELLIVSDGNKILFNKSYKGIHYSVTGADLYSCGVSELIRDSLKASKLNLIDCIGICIGTAGAREEKDRNKLKKLFEKCIGIKNILITTDAMTALYGAFEGDEGIILISGTGSVLYGYSKNKITRIGGWGRIIGDEGSGYWIGKRALNLIAKEYDEQKKEQSKLALKLNKTFGINKQNINEKVFHGNFEIQKITPAVIECAKNKCKMSKTIVNEAVDGLTDHIKTFLKVSGTKKPIKIAFVGSVIENKNILSEKLKKEIRKLKIVNVVRKKHSSAFGAVLLASENSSITKKL